MMMNTFQYAETVALSYDEIVNNLQRILRIELFIHKYNWKGINYQSRKDGW